jgi:hypothetical protein
VASGSRGAVASGSRSGSRASGSGGGRGGKASGDRDGDTGGLADTSKDGDKLCCGVVSMVQRDVKGQLVDVLAWSSGWHLLETHEVTDLVMAAWPVVHWHLTSETPQPEAGMAATRQGTWWAWSV